jgi:hypothetical protein
MARPSPNLGSDRPDQQGDLLNQKNSHGLPSFGVPIEGPPTIFGKGEHKGQVSPLKGR